MFLFEHTMTAARESPPSSYRAFSKRKDSHLAEILPLGTATTGKKTALAAGERLSGKLLLASDVFAMLLAFVLGGIVASLKQGTPLTLIPHTALREFLLFLGLGSLMLLSLDSKGHYRTRLPYWEGLGHIVGMVLIGFLAGGFVQFALKSATSRLWLGTSWISFGMLLYLGRVLVRRTLKALDLWTIPSLMIGCGPAALEAQKALAAEPEMGYEIVSVLEAENLNDLKKPEAWSTLLGLLEARHIFLALEGEDFEKYRAAINALGLERVPYTLVPSWHGLPLRGLSTHTFAMQDVLMLQDTNPLNLTLPRLVKRAFDLLASGSALLVLSPVFLVLSLFIRHDGGPAFFTQPRIGKGGKIFKCHKFRSMRTDAEEVLARYLMSDSAIAAEWETYQKLKEDPRITRVGAFLRKTSLDELPQLIDVFLGAMSLVGPRPILIGQEKYYEENYVAYCSVKPGITGPWQVSGRNRLSFQERVRLEAWYTRNWTFWLDIVIILKTFPALFTKDTAY